MTIEDGIGWTWVSNQVKEARSSLSFLVCHSKRGIPAGITHVRVLRGLDSEVVCR